jgi:uncharacterized protein YoxC
MKNKIINLAIVGLLFVGLLLNTSSLQAQTLNRQSSEFLKSMIQAVDSFVKLLASVTDIIVNQVKDNVQQTESVQKAKEIIDTIQAQVDTLKTVINETSGISAGRVISQQVQEINLVVPQLSKTLRPGDSGQDVITLQEYLSSKSDIYPEQLVTGYYGPLTKQAVSNLQKKLGLEQTGIVDSKTLIAINQQLAEQANMVTVPSGLSLQEYTVALLNTINEWKQAPAAKRLEIAIRLAKYAKERKAVMLQEIMKNPRAVLDNAIPSSIIASLPSNIQSLFEQEVTIRGKFKAIHIDYPDDTSRYEFFVIDENMGKFYRLHFANKKYPNAMTDDRVQVHGVRVDSEIVLADSSENITVLAASSSSILPNTFGTKKILVILINFSNYPTLQPYTVSDVQNVMNVTNNFFKENSFNQALLSGVKDVTKSADVTNWMTIPALADGSCSYWTWASQAKTAAANAGYNLADYTNYIYAFPNKDTGCDWGGLGTIGGNPAEAWINGNFTLRIAAHELGHNFGLYHSHSMSCNSGSSCTTSEYGDIYDVMGISNSWHFNAFQKSRLGWLNYNISPPITFVSTSGIYTIAPYETNDTRPKALQILKSSGTNNTYYYVEYRAGLGFDSGTPVVIIHRATPADANSSYLWDLDQITTVSDWILDVGQRYEDTTAGVSIKNLYQDSNGAQIEVTLGPIACVSNNPLFTISPLSTSLVAGQSASFKYTLTNNDTASCPSSNFSIIPSLPTGFSQSPSPINYTLLPGESVSGSFIISTATNTVPGSYSVVETAQNMSTSTIYKSSVSLAINVLPPDTMPPTVTIISPTDGTIVSKGNIFINASASDESGIAEIRIFVDGGLIKTCYNANSCSGNVNSNKLTLGTHKITAQATDKGWPVANTNSASITIIKK